MIELLAVVAALDHWAPYLRGKYIILVDNEPVEAALVKGYSTREDTCGSVAIFWDLSHNFDIAVYISDVPTDSNPSDGPSRGAFWELEKRGGLA